MLHLPDIERTLLCAPTDTPASAQGMGMLPGRAVEGRERVLLLESDTDIAEMLRQNICLKYDVTVCPTVSDALQAGPAQYSLIILDTNVKGSISGYDFIAMLRRSPLTDDIPFIVCSDADTEDDIVRGFDAGAEDYIVKPFSLREMRARVNAVMRRRHTVNEIRAQRASIMVAGPLRVGRDSQRVTLEGVPVDLTRIEFMLLTILMHTPGRHYPRHELQNAVWGHEPVGERTVDVNISRLRKKLGQYASMIVNTPGRGYSFKEP